MFKTQCECTSLPILRIMLRKMCAMRLINMDPVVIKAYLDDVGTIVDEIVRRS